MNTQTQEQLDLHQLGQQAYGSIIAAKKHDLKGANLWLSAGLLLIEAKAKVGHGGWGKWLAEHKISDRSARRAVQIASSPDPHKAAEALRAQNAEDVRKHRASSDEAESALRKADLNITQPSLLDVRRLLKSATEAQLLAVKDLLLKLRAIAQEQTT